MNIASIEKIADTVLFEGYILYPYRPSAIKNRQRWNFGTLYPQPYAQAQSRHEPWAFHAEILIEGSPDSLLSTRIRFLQLVAPGFDSQSDWSEGFVRSRDADDISLDRLERGFEQVFDFSELAGEESQRAPGDYLPIQTKGRLSLIAELLRDGLYKIRATFANETSMGEPCADVAATAQSCSFTSAHLLLQIQDGSFVSLLEPQPELELEAQQCVNQGVFPVLVGDKGDRSTMLCSPIILYDYPQVAPESKGDFFDGCEMDEMLALRVLTLTDDEKAEVRRGDPRARNILARTENLLEDHLLELHGAVRDVRPVVTPDAQEHSSGVGGWNPFDERPPVETVRVFGVDVRKGDRVRLWPQKKADIMDMAMQGKVAVVEAIEEDFEENVQLAVVLEDDPGFDMGMLRQAGHRFFFHPEEIEPLRGEMP